MLATALVPYLGYEAAAAIAKRALATGRTVADVALEAGGLTREQLDLALRAEVMLGPAAAPNVRDINAFPCNELGRDDPPGPRGRNARYRPRRHPIQTTACSARSAGNSA